MRSFGCIFLYLGLHERLKFKVRNTIHAWLSLKLQCPTITGHHLGQISGASRYQDSQERRPWNRYSIKSTDISCSQQETLRRCSTRAKRRVPNSRTVIVSGNCIIRLSCEVIFSTHRGMVSDRHCSKSSEICCRTKARKS